MSTELRRIVSPEARTQFQRLYGAAGSHALSKRGHTSSSSATSLGVILLPQGPGPWGAPHKTAPHRRIAQTALHKLHCNMSRPGLIPPWRGCAILNRQEARSFLPSSPWNSRLEIVSRSGAASRCQVRAHSPFVSVFSAGRTWKIHGVPILADYFYSPPECD